MTSYADASFVVSLYLPDAHSAAAIEWASTDPNQVCLTPLGAPEVINVIRLRVFRSERTVSQSTQSIQAFEGDVAAGVLRLLPVPPSAWTNAQRLSKTHSAALGTRSLDILQVACAISLRADSFLTFDIKQAELARAEGLQTPI